MTQNLNDKDYQKALDLRRIYGQKGLSDLLNINQAVIDLVLARKDEIEEKMAAHVRAGVRRYWQTWMGKCGAVAEGGQRSSKKVVVSSKDKSLAQVLTVPKMVVRMGKHENG
jgi:hypothetical protein